MSGKKLINVYYYIFGNIELLCNLRLFLIGFMITWILHLIIMYSNKVKLVAGYKTDPPMNNLYPIPSPSTG